MNLSPQEQKMVEALRSNPAGLTALGLLHAAGTLRASARAWDLRKKGVDIQCRPGRCDDGVVRDWYVLVAPVYAGPRQQRLL